MSLKPPRVAAFVQLLRVKPVASWGLSALVLGSAIAYSRTGAAVNVQHGVLAAVLVVLAQGFVSHGLNDVYDWVTGTDRESIGKGTGGSRVIPEGKLSVMGTLATALVALAGVIAIGAYFVTQYGAPMLVLLTAAVWSPVAYSTPPLKLGYRPFNELAVVFPALVGVVVGADLVLAGSWSWLAVGVGVLHALFCISWFIVSRVPDYKPDKRVGKVTSVVYVGRENAGLLSASYLAFALATAAVLVVEVSLVFVLSFSAWSWMMLGLAALDPYDPEQASRIRLRNMHATTAHALVLSGGLVAVGV